MRHTYIGTNDVVRLLSFEASEDDFYRASRHNSQSRSIAVDICQMLQFQVEEREN